MKKLTLVLLALFIASNAFGATQLLKTINPDGTHNYTSLEACFNANEQNLVTADKYFTLEVSGIVEEGGGAQIYGYTTDATRYIEITSDPTDRHNGTNNGAATVKFTTAATFNGYLAGAEEYIRIHHLIFDCNDADINDNIINMYYYVKEARIYNNIFVGNSGTGTLGKGCVSVGSPEAAHVMKSYVYNNIAYNFTKDYHYFCIQTDDVSDLYAENNSVYNCSRGFASDGVGCTTILYNNIVYATGSVALDLYIKAGGAATEDYNVSNDTDGNFQAANSTRSAVLTGGAYNIEWESTTNLHLKSTSSCIDDGKSTGLNTQITDDIDDVARSGTWDIGADEYVSAVVAWVQGQMVMMQ